MYNEKFYKKWVKWKMLAAVGIGSMHNIEKVLLIVNV